MNSVLVGMFDSQAQAQAARTQLIAAGFAASAVSLTGGEGAMGSGEPAATVTGTTGSTSSSSMASGEREHEGGIAHFFRTLFGGDDDEDTSRRYERDQYGSTYQEAFRRGSYGVAVTAQSDDEVSRAEEVLNQAGAVDIDERSQQWRSEGWTGGQTGAYAATGGTASAASASSTEGTQTLQEMEEELKIGKRAVVRGGVRVFTRMVETPVEESVRLREEHADIQRRSVDRPATAADFDAFKEGSVEVREMAEEAVVSKTARVVGEVEIGTQVTEREETVRDTVRKTTVDVEQIDDTVRTSENGGMSSTSGTSGTSTSGTRSAGTSSDIDRRDL